MSGTGFFSGRRCVPVEGKGKTEQRWRGDPGTSRRREVYAGGGMKNPPPVIPV